jgi:hypothetical protein
MAEPEDEVWRWYKKTLGNVKLWTSSFSELRLTTDEESGVKEKLEVHKKEVGNMFENRRRQLRGFEFQTLDGKRNLPLDMLETIIQKITGGWR